MRRGKSAGRWWLKADAVIEATARAVAFGGAETSIHHTGQLTPSTKGVPRGMCRYSVVSAVVQWTIPGCNRRMNLNGH